jgi:acetolactate synthase-1/2/3 large subunit
MRWTRARLTALCSLCGPIFPANGALTSDAMGAIIARLMPEDAIWSDDSLTAGPGLQKHLVAAPRHDAIFLTGGAIGDAKPMAMGAAIACPDRKVIAVSGDGAAMYSLPTLWSMAREKLDVVTIVCANRSYNILNIELGRVGAINPGPKDIGDARPARSGAGFRENGAGHGRECHAGANHQRVRGSVRRSHAHAGPASD